MNRLEQRIKRLEGQAATCNHHSPLILANPTEGEVEQKERELDECPSCRKHGRPKMVIMHYPDQELERRFEALEAKLIQQGGNHR